MASNLFTLLLLLILLMQQGVAQTTNVRGSIALIETLSNKEKGSKKAPTPKNIKGEPYFNSKFLPAEVLYFGEKVEGEVFLRYNAFNDEIEMASTAYQTDSDEILLKNKNLVCSIFGETYKYLSYYPDESDFPKVGYFVLLMEGKNTAFYVKRTKKFMDATVARTSLERSFPPRFVDDIKYYYGVDEKTLIQIDLSKKGIGQQFGNGAKKYLKDNKLQLKNEKDLEGLFTFIDSNYSEK